MILITGSTGLIGRSLQSGLSDNALDFRAAVRQYVAAGPEEQEVIKSLDEDTDWRKALVGIHVVIHLAAQVHVRPKSSLDVEVFHEVNVLGTRHLAESAAKAGVRRFIFLSTVKVHGENSGPQPFKESDPLNPQDPYAESKARAEVELRRIGRDSGMEIVILRPPLVYGPGVKANFLSLLNVVSKQLPLPLGGITNKRSMIYIGNLVDAIVSCIEHPAAAGETFLVSDGADISTPDLCRSIAAEMGYNARLPALPVQLLTFAGKLLAKSDIVDRLASSLLIDSSHIRQKLAWAPPFTFQEGLHQTVRWYLDTHQHALHA